MTPVRQLRNTCFSATTMHDRQRNFRETAADDDEHEQPSSSPRPTTVEPPSYDHAIEPLVTPAASLDPASATTRWFAYSQRL